MSISRKKSQYWLRGVPRATIMNNSQYWPRGVPRYFSTNIMPISIWDIIIIFYEG